MGKFYFETPESEIAYTIDYFDEMLVRPFTIFEAVQIKVDGFFFCKAALECGQSGTCGKMCDDYAPRNGRSGICRHKAPLFTAGAAVTFN